MVVEFVNEAMEVLMVGSGGVCVWQDSEFSCLENIFIFNLVYK